jgi:hypothetical protein
MLVMRHIATSSWEMGVACLVVSVISRVWELGMIDHIDDEYVSYGMVAHCCYLIL